MTRAEIEWAIRQAHALGWSREQIEQMVGPARAQLTFVDQLLVDGELIRWFGLPVAQPAPSDDVFRADLDAEFAFDREGATKTAENLLEEALADGDWHESADVKKHLLAAGGFAERSVQRAAKNLGVEAERRGYPATTYWRIADATSATAAAVATESDACAVATEDLGLTNGFSESLVAPVNKRGRARRLPGIGILLRRTNRAQA